MGCLCRFICKHPGLQIPSRYNTLFISSLQKWLSSGEIEIVTSIIVNSEKIFSINLPRMEMIIAPFLVAIKFLMASNTVSENEEMSCLKILSSVMHVSNCLTLETSSSNETDGSHLKKDNPNTEEHLNNESIATSGTVFDGIRSDIFILFLGVLNKHLHSNVNSSNSIISASISNIGILIFDELSANSISGAKIVIDGFQAIFDSVSIQDHQRAGMSISCLNTILSNQHLLNISAEIAPIIVDHLLSKISRMIDLDDKAECTVESIKESATNISNLFRCAVNSFASNNNLFTGNENIYPKLFGVIEQALYLNYQLVDNTTSMSLRSLTESPQDRLSSSVDNLAKNKELEEVSQSVRTSAENALKLLLQCASDYFALQSQTELALQNAADIGEDEDGSNVSCVFSFEDHTLVTVIPVASEDINVIIMRNSTGKYTWNPSKLYSNLITLSSATADSNDDFNKGQSSTNLAASADLNTDNRKNMTSHPDIPNVATWNFSKFLIALVDDHKRCIVSLLKDSSQSVLCLKPLGIRSKMPAEVRTLYERSSREVKQSIAASLEQATNSGNKGSMISNLVPSKRESVFKDVKSFLDHLAKVSLNSMVEGEYTVLNKTPGLFRDIRGLDKQFGREVAKVALIYVGQGQEDQNTILSNSQGSSLYDEFVESLGSLVELANHTGYMGGLDRIANGQYAPYYCTPSTEVIFHDVTRMPTDLDDPKQLKKVNNYYSI